jgi:uncharacterized membrane protein
VRDSRRADHRMAYFRAMHEGEGAGKIVGPRVEGTGRLEAFSDGVIAIIVTLLIFEVRLPDVGSGTDAEIWAALGTIAPKFISFTVSFFTVAIFWVNHHHFFSRVTHSDWKLLWANNLLLFFLAIVPFTTAVLGDHSASSVAAAMYALNLGLAAAAFTLMGSYVFFLGDLVPASVSRAERRREWKRSWLGTAGYLSAVVLAFVAVPIALAIFAIIPIAFVIPNLLRGDDAA